MWPPYCLSYVEKCLQNTNTSEELFSENSQTILYIYSDKSDGENLNLYKRMTVMAVLENICSRFALGLALFLGNIIV